MATNSVYGFRTYLAATTDPKTGRADLTMERQVALMMLG